MYSLAVADRHILRALGLVAASLFAAITLSARQGDAPKPPVGTQAGQAGPDELKKTDKKSDGAAAKRAAGAKQAEVRAGYRVGPDDELTISVWHEPELSQAVVVRPDGKITLPLLNDIAVAGLTTDELQALLTEKLKALVNDPQVTVIVKAVKSQKVFMVGAVGKQGVYPLSGELTVLQLIAQAGGLGPFAKSRSIYILRNVDGKQVKIPFNYKKAVSGKGNDPVLQSGDMIVVP